MPGTSLRTSAKKRTCLRAKSSEVITEIMLPEAALAVGVRLAVTTTSGKVCPTP